ncbi:MAG: chromosome segregation protein SMC [Thermodesulfovibrionales bacterium]
MKIEKIELSGFKSFAERISLQLHPGITGIVGPNGCGKSNLVDAIKWLLGEQSAKSLRGDKMDELIFNGSQTRKPKGMAEVSLHISGLSVPSEDNGSGDNNLTIITRRIYRSGDSEYAINNNLCRLKDIKDILLDTGLDVKNYFIFEQERLSQLINAKPQDRRFLIEEIAGVIKYKVKKAEAIAKLEQSKINLQRVNDIIQEVKRQLNSLDRQVKKAERFKRLSEERRLIELYLAKHQFDQLKEIISELSEKLNSLKEKEAAKRAEIDTLQNTIQQGRLLLIEREKSMKDLYSELEEKERLIADNEKAMIQAVAEAEAHKKEKERLELEGEENLKKISELREKIIELSGMRDSLKLSIEESQKRIEELFLSLKSSEENIASSEQTLEENRKALFQLSDKISMKSNEKTRLQANLESIEKRASLFEKEMSEIQERIKNIDIEIENLEREIKFSTEELISLRNRRDEIITGIEKEEFSLQSLTEEIQQSKEELASLHSRLSSLKELILDEATALIFQRADSLHIKGVVSDLFEVPQRYEKAIEGILAERINAFILSDMEDLKRAMSIIREQGISRTSFFSEGIVLNQEPERVDLPAGSINAIDIINVLDERFRALFNSIFRNTVIVDSIDEAIRIKKEGFKVTVATLDGDVIDESGMVYSGKGKEVLKRKREIKELESLIDNIKGKIERKTAELERAKERLSVLEKELENTEGLIDTEEARITGFRHSLDTVLQEKERLHKRISFIHLERDETLREKELLNNEIKKRDEEIKGLEEKKGLLESEIELKKNELLQRRQEIETLRHQYTDLRMTHTRNRENYNSVLKEIEGSEKMIRTIEEEKGQILITVEELQKKTEGLLKTIEELKVKTSQYAIQATEIKEKISKERQEMEQESQRFLEMEEQVKILREELDDLLKNINEIDVQRAEATVRLEGIKDAINVNYGIDIENINEKEFSLDGSIEELSERLNVIRKKIDELGPVNLGTIEEYEELKERYNFLSSQQEDLTKSISELEEAIQKINTTTRKKLREAFDALNEKFSEVFTSLFGGGKAFIVLTDENNILESGIEIVAQPPGKKLQNINLLSGGEKALTALSLLVASFLIKPAPLCILDEADAPLDDANVDRFARMLKELSKLIQFIVITHNKTTMSYCDYLYGVTMEEPGVSKIISLQLSSV